jgi:hypothetical protein
MDAQSLPIQRRIELTAPPPPMRRRLHVPAEPLVFAAVMLVLTLGLARALPQAESPANASGSSPQVVVAHANPS